MTPLAKEYQAYCAKFGTPERIELMMCDLNAVLRGKWLNGEEFAKLETGEVRLPLSAYAPNIAGQEVDATGLGSVCDDPDGYIFGIPGTLAPVPWAGVHIAQLMIDMTEKDAGISELSPRNALALTLNRMNADGYFPVVATELEFYIYQPRGAASDPPIPLPHTPQAQNYDLDAMARQEAILLEILETSSAQGLATDTLIAEYGPGQFEVNFHHTGDVMRAADTVILFRRLVRNIVARHGLCATFMAKPYPDSPGNGMHVHVSVNDKKGSNIFSTSRPDINDSLQSAVAGVLATMRDLQAIFAPHMNSYRRFKPNSFAPTTPDWGLDNRNAAVRLPETKGKGARFEHRICGADVNPYLALAAILGGAHYGLRTAMKPPLRLEDPACVRAAPLSHDWASATERFADSAIAAEIYGERYRHIYAAVRRNEIAMLSSAISPAEYNYYLGRM